MTPFPKTIILRLHISPALRQMGNDIVETPDRKDTVTFKVGYARTDDVLAVLVNHFVLQVDRGDFILTLGQVLPPIVLGEEPNVRIELSEMKAVIAKVVGRVVLSRERAQALRDLLDRQMALYDELGDPE